jgi:O-acetylserine/cysteine efflux transporter
MSAHPHRLSLPHVLLALAVVAVWGTNFVVIKNTLVAMPPFLFASLRFALIFFPAVFLFKRPATPWPNMALYGIALGVGQFGMLYLAIQGHISPGLASLVIQTQVFFTIGLAMALSGEGMRGFQALALGLAIAGIALIAWHTHNPTHNQQTTTPLGLMLVLCAAFSWAIANIVNKKAGAVNMLAYVVWSSVYALPPLLCLSWVFEGWPLIRASLSQADLSVWGAVLWQSWANSIFGYAAWGWLLSQYTAATVTPMALLVPVFGMGASAWLLGEDLPPWKLVAASLVMGGLLINVLWPQWPHWQARLRAL